MEPVVIDATIELQTGAVKKDSHLFGQKLSWDRLYYEWCAKCIRSYPEVAGMQAQAHNIWKQWLGIYWRVVPWYTTVRLVGLLQCKKRDEEDWNWGTICWEVSPCFREGGEPGWDLSEGGSLCRSRAFPPARLAFLICERQPVVAVQRCLLLAAGWHQTPPFPPRWLQSQPRSSSSSSSSAVCRSLPPSLRPSPATAPRLVPRGGAEAKRATRPA